VKEECEVKENMRRKEVKEGRKERRKKVKEARKKRKEGRKEPKIWARLCCATSRTGFGAAHPFASEPLPPASPPEGGDEGSDEKDNFGHAPCQGARAVWRAPARSSGRGTAKAKHTKSNGSFSARI
jgi:hypothetical protein